MGYSQDVVFPWGTSYMLCYVYHPHEKICFLTIVVPIEGISFNKNGIPTSLNMPNGILLKTFTPLKDVVLEIFVAI